MDDLIRIPLEYGTHIIDPRFLRVESAPGFVGKGRSGIQMFMLLPFQFFSECHLQHLRYFPSR